MRKILMTSAIVGLLAAPAFAHCDSMDGPVVQDAQRAIAEETVTPVLKWVTAADEDEIRSAFEMTLAVRGESDAAMEIAGRSYLTIFGVAPLRGDSDKLFDAEFGVQYSRLF